MNHLRKLLVIVALLSSSVAFAQLTDDPEDRREQGREPLRTQTVDGQSLPLMQRLRFGGGISALQFGNPNYGVPFIIGVSPVVAYQAAERLVVGVGIDYQFARLRAFDTAGQRVNLTANQYGGRGFVMYELIPSIIPGIYAHGEVASTSIQNGYNIPGRPRPGRFNVTAPLLGVTYSQRVGRLAGINVSALYNLNYTAQSRYLYNSPFVFRILFF